MSNKLVIRNNNGTLSVAVFESIVNGQYGERKVYGAAIRKSVKNKQTNEWDEYKLSLFEDEMCTLAELLSMTHQDLIRLKSASRGQNPQETAKTEETINEIGDDIPF